MNFGTQLVANSSSAQSVTLTNSGNAALSINSIAVSGANAINFVQSNNCGSSLAAGSSCVINITFKPTASGAATATLSVTDDGSGSPPSASLSGTGTSTAAVVEPRSH